MDLERQEALASQRGKVIADSEMRPAPNGLSGGLLSSTGLPELSKT